MRLGKDSLFLLDESHRIRDVSKGSNIYPVVSVTVGCLKNYFKNGFESSTESLASKREKLHQSLITLRSILI